MTSIDLRQSKITIDDLLHLADDDQVIIIATDRREFILEEADDFEKEVLALGQSENFMRFLKKRAEEPGLASLNQVAKELLSEGN